MENTSRRTFCQNIALGVGAIAASRKANSSEPSESKRIFVATTNELETGVVKNFYYSTDSHDAFILKLNKPAQYGVGSEQNIVSFLKACTHRGCLIGEEFIDTENGMLGPCPCHRSLFDLKSNGKQVRGRATQNLVQVKLEVVNGNIYAVSVMGVPYGESIKQECV